MKLVQALCRDKTELEHSGLFFPQAIYTSQSELIALESTTLVLCYTSFGKYCRRKKWVDQI